MAGIEIEFGADVKAQTDIETETNMEVKAVLEAETGMKAGNSEFDIYSDLYDIADARLRENGKEMIASKEAFRYMTLTDLGTCEGDYLKKADDTDFLAMAYLGFLKRLPDPKGEESWGKRREECPETYRGDIIRTFRVIKNVADCNTSLEYNCVPRARMIEGTYLYNQAMKKRSYKGDLRRRIYELFHENRLIVNLYENSPLWMKRFMRKISGLILGRRQS